MNLEQKDHIVTCFPFRDGIPALRLVSSSRVIITSFCSSQLFCFTLRAGWCWVTSICPGFCHFRKFEVNNIWLSAGKANEVQVHPGFSELPTGPVRNV